MFLFYYLYFQILSHLHSAQFLLLKMSDFLLLDKKTIDVKLYVRLHSYFS